MKELPDKVAELIMGRFVCKTAPYYNLFMAFDSKVLDYMQEEIKKELEYQEAKND